MQVVSEAIEKASGNNSNLLTSLKINSQKIETLNHENSL